MYNKSSDYILPQAESVGFFNSLITMSNLTETKNHITNNWHIEFYTENGGVAFVNDREYKIRAGNVLIAPEGSVRRSKLHFKCYYLHLKISEGLYFDELSKLPPIISISDTQKIQKLFQKMILYFYSNNPAEHIKFNAVLADFLDIFISQSKNKAAEKAGVIEKAEQFIIDNCNADITLEDIAKAVNLSPVYFHKKFKTAKGISPHEYLCEKRIERAKFLLLSGDKQLTEIAFECGFSSSSYFICFFKEKTGMTPKKFREENFKLSKIL